MNKVSLIGRVTKDIELISTQSDKSIARFTLAVNRRTKDKESDFISCIAWNKTAEVMSQYVKKCNRIGITGHIQTGSYEKDGKKVYTTDVVVEELDFIEKKDESYETAQPTPDDFIVPDNVEDLPFK